MVSKIFQTFCADFINTYNTFKVFLHFKHKIMTTTLKKIWKEGNVCYGVYYAS